MAFDLPIVSIPISALDSEVNALRALQRRANVERFKKESCKDISSDKLSALPCPKVELSDEQLEVLNLVKSGKNVFFTGAAGELWQQVLSFHADSDAYNLGTGKSVLLREVIKSLREMGIKVAVTATTGIAGLNIQGTTIHSFAGIGLGKEPADELAKNIAKSARKKEKWVQTRVLVIDESSYQDVSILYYSSFDLLSFHDGWPAF
jgi:ATP-dependent DNA helicase PIF1